MAVCSICQGTYECTRCHPGSELLPASSDVAQVVEPCPAKCTATVLVKDSNSGKGITGVTVEQLSGSPKTDANGLTHFKDLAPGALTAKLSLAGLENRYALPRIGADKQTKTVGAGGYGFFVFELDPLTTLEVTVARSDRDGLGVKDAVVQMTVEGRAQISKTTSGDDGKVVFEKIRKGQAELKLELKGTAKVRFNVNGQFEQQTRATAQTASRSVQLDLSKEKNEAKFLVTPMIYLKLKFKDPEGTVRCFPKNFPLTVLFAPTGGTLETKIIDDDGRLTFPAGKNQTHFTLKFDHAALRLLTVAKDADKATWVDGPSEKQMQDMLSVETRFFSLPHKWSLVHASWETANVTLPRDGKVAIPVDGVGTESTPGELTLCPKVQYARFLFHDRKYGPSDHAKRQVGIPAVVLKAARKSDADGKPVDPVAGTHDVVSGWMISPADNAAACQAVPWIVTRKDDGNDLPRLDKTMMLEFGWPDGYVISNGPTGAGRVIETMAASDPRRVPHKDRNKFYDLPALWKSKCYYTRLAAGDADETKNRFFDELTEEEIETSMAPDKPLKFSLDDIVLVQNDSQAVRDKDRSDNPIDLYEYSRVALLHLDGPQYKVAVFNPVDQGYFSKTLFDRDQNLNPPSAAFNPRRNVLLHYPHNARAVVFCDGFHDIFDKRTTTATFASRHLLGARAAVLDDEKLHESRVFSQGDVVTKAYMHKTRAFKLHYLHYAECNGTTVFDAMVTHWSALVFSRDSERPATLPGATQPPFPLHKPMSGNALHARNYRDIGLKKAMERWNHKDYQFEEHDDKTAIVVKTFCLFEAKEVEHPQDTFRLGGGRPYGYLGVGGTRSSAISTWMHMRLAAYQEETRNDDGAHADLGGAEQPALVIAHELGHLAIGLWDDYVTQTWQGIVPGYHERDANGAIVPQRYPGIPYNRDAPSMMNPNRSPRLRMFWGRANWLNDESKSGGRLNRFTQGRRFQVTWPASPVGKLKYHLDEPSRNYYAPTHQAADHSLGEGGAATLYLYKLGDDEFARQMPGGPYKGILVIEQRICVHFRTGVTPAAPGWAAGQAYTAGKCVEYLAKFYACLEDHTSVSSAPPPGTQWIEVKPEDTDANPVAAWAPNQAMVANRWYSSGGMHYVVRRAHTSGERIGEFFQGLTAPAPWVAKTRYALTSTVLVGGRVFRCIRAHKSGKVFVPAFWEDVGADHGAYADGVDLLQGDHTTFGGASFVCRVAHGTGSLAADVLAGRMVACDRAPSAWTANAKLIWVSNANGAFVRAIEDDGTGKFKLVGAGGAFSPTYVRMFAQWADKASPGDPNPPDTQFNFDVVKGGGAACFAATGRAVSAGSETDAKTIVRYLFGRISADPAIRASQNLTADLVAADFDTIVRWMKDRDGGAMYQVQAV